MDSTFWLLCIGGGCLGWFCRDWQEVGMVMLGEVLGMISMIVGSN